MYPNDLALRGYVEIVRTAIVREFVSTPKGLQAVPRLSAEFLTNFDRFNLNAQEGYLVSLIDGRLDLQKLTDPLPLRRLQHVLHPREAPAGAGNHGAAMNDDNATRSRRISRVRSRSSTRTAASNGATAPSTRPSATMPPPG